MSHNINEDDLRRFLNFLHEESLRRPFDFISIDEIVGRMHMTHGEILRLANHCVNNEWVEPRYAGVIVAVVKITDEGIDKLEGLSNSQNETTQQEYRINFRHRTRNILGHSVLFWTIMGIAITTIFGSYFIWLPPLQCQFQVEVQDETYINCPLGFQISRPSPDWSFNDVENQLKLSENSDLLGGIVVQSPYYDNVRVLVFKNNLNTIQEFRQNEIQAIQSKYNITSMWTLPTLNEPDLIQLFAKNKNSTIFLKERVETQNGKIFVIQQNAQVFFAPSLSNDTMNTLNQIYQSFGYKGPSNKS